MNFSFVKRYNAFDLERYKAIQKLRRKKYKKSLYKSIINNPLKMANPISDFIDFSEDSIDYSKDSGDSNDDEKQGD